MTITPNKWELDVQGYLNVCNITSATPRKQIRDFSAGVNDLGLWNSMVCWPLRSSQNYGSGTTAFSLGGLGTFNGTLTNGPTWTTDGVSFDGTDDFIITPLEANDHPSGISELVVFNAPADTVAYSMFFGDENGSAGHATMIRRNDNLNKVNMVTNFTGGGTDVIQDITFGQWNSVHIRIVAPASFLSVNTTSESSGTSSGTFAPPNSTTDRVGFGARAKAVSPEFAAKMTAAFGAFWSSGTSSAQMQAVKTLYKQTLGTGLLLP